jgi:hypothetical protein
VAAFSKLLFALPHHLPVIAHFLSLSLLSLPHVRRYTRVNVALPPLSSDISASLRGVTPGLKVASVEGVGKVAVANGIAAAIELLQNDNWKQEYVMIEVRNTFSIVGVMHDARPLLHRT